MAAASAPVAGLNVYCRMQALLERKKKLPFFAMAGVVLRRESREATQAAGPTAERVAGLRATIKLHEAFTPPTMSCCVIGFHTMAEIVQEGLKAVVVSTAIVDVLTRKKLGLWPNHEKRAPAP